MRIKRRTEVNVESREVWVIRRQQGRSRVRCAQCRDAPMVAPEEAAALAHTSTRTIYRRVEAGLIHYVETPGGGLLVCLHSLTAQAGVE